MYKIQFFYVNHDDYRLSHMLSAQTLPNEEILFSSTPVLMESQSSDFKKNSISGTPRQKEKGGPLKASHLLMEIGVIDDKSENDLLFLGETRILIGCDWQSNGWKLIDFFYFY